jgi:hypothetical protein
VSVGKILPMETFLEVDGVKRQKKLRGKTYFLHHSNISLKVTHELDLDSCQIGFWGTILKVNIVLLFFIDNPVAFVQIC